MKTANLLSVVMPFHNEESTLVEVVSQVLNVDLPIPMELILVDDGSTDSSSERIIPFMTDERVSCIKSARRCGKGAAVKLGLAVCRGNIVLIQDADLEYSPREYTSVLELILENKCDFALGSRVLGAGTWRVRRIDGRPLYSLALNSGALGLALIFRVLFGAKLTDPTTMMKVFRREFLQGMEFSSRGFDWDWELLCKFVRKGLVPLETPISYKARAPQEGKKLRIWKDGWAALFAILRVRFSTRFEA